MPAISIITWIWNKLPGCWYYDYYGDNIAFREFVFMWGRDREQPIGVLTPAKRVMRYWYYGKGKAGIKVCR